MKKYFLIIPLFLFLIACGSKDEKDKDNLKDSTTVENNFKEFENEGQLHSLKYKFEPDVIYKYRLISESKTTQNIEADSNISITFDQKMTYDVSLNVREIETDGVMDIRITFTAITSEANANGQKFTYKSGEVKDSLEKLRHLDYESVYNNPFNVRVKPNGEIIEVYKTDKIVDRVLSLQNAADKVTPEERRQLMSQISDGAIKPLLQQLFRLLPEKEVGKDSSWVHNYPSQLAVFTIMNSAKYRIDKILVDKDELLAQVDASLDIAVSGKDKFTENGINYKFQKPEATGTGSLFFNIDKGFIQKINTQTKLKMTMIMDMPQSPQGPLKAKRTDIIESKNSIIML